MITFCQSVFIKDDDDDDDEVVIQFLELEIGTTVKCLLTDVHESKIQLETRNAK